MSEINIVIPTYNRPQGLLGVRYFGQHAKWVLPESQQSSYWKVLNKEQMIIIPDKCDGNIGRKRNWILDNIPRPLIMIDDDVRHISTMQGRVADEDFTPYIKVDIEVFIEFIQQGFEVCDQFGAKMWGVAQKPDEREYREFIPLNMTKPVLGPFTGHLDHPLRYDEEMGSKDDYDMALQQLREYKKVIRLNYMAYDCDHGNNAGGIVSMRTQ
ncbi:MAG: hypothetical protein JKY80_07000, partial [Mariprofundaceae bacterium]|nr:hypothetical protein [Mariprofundaceae bacterium]